MGRRKIWKKTEILFDTLFSNVPIFLFHPTLPFFSIIINSAVNKFQGGTFQPLNFNKDQFKEILLYAWFIGSIGYYFYRRKKKKWEKRLQDKESIIKEKNVYLDQSAGIILNKYGEFLKFQNHIKFQEILKGLVDNNTPLASAQIFRYSSRCFDGIVKIRLNLEAGYAYEEMDTNSLFQTYYEIRQETYNILVEEIIPEREDLLGGKVRKNQFKQQWKSLSEKMQVLYDSIYDKLSKISDVKNIEEVHFSEYRILVMLIRFLSEQGVASKLSSLLKENRKDVEELLNSGKRTGTLISILTGEACFFKNTKSCLKKGRYYMSCLFEDEGQGYILLMSIPPKIMNDKDELEENLDRLTNDFFRRLEAKKK